MSADKNGGISWPAVAISWVISTVTTIILIAIAFAIQRCANNKNASKNDSSDETFSEDRRRGNAPGRNGSIDSIEEALTPSAGNNVRKQATSKATTAASRTGNRPIFEPDPRQRITSPVPAASYEQRTERPTLRVEKEKRPNNNFAVAADNVRSPVPAESAPTVLRPQPVRISHSSPQGQTQPSAADETRHSNHNRLRDNPNKDHQSAASTGTVAVSTVAVAVSRESLRTDAAVEYARQRPQLVVKTTDQRSVSQKPSSGPSAVVPISLSSGSRQSNQPVMTLQPLSAAALMPPVASVRNHPEPSRDQKPLRTAGQRLNQTVYEEEEIEPMRLAPLSEKHRQQKMRTNSYRRQVPLAEGEDLDELSARGRQDVENTSSTSSLSDTSSLSGAQRSDSASEDTESSIVAADLVPAAVSSSRHPPKPPVSASIFTPLTTWSAAASSAVPIFTSRPTAMNSDLLRPEPLRQSVRRRPVSLDNALGTDSSHRSPDVWSSGLLESGGRDSRLTAWQRVQVSLRSAHSEPIIVPIQRIGEASLIQVSGPSQPAAVISTPCTIKTSTPFSSVSETKPSQQRLRQVIRDPSANPSPPVSLVNSSTPLSVAVVKADRRRRQRPDQTDAGSRGDPTVNLVWSKSCGTKKQNTSNESSSRKVDKSQRSSASHKKTAGGRRTGHQAPPSRDFFSPGPMQTSTPGPSGPSTPTHESKRYKNLDDLRKNTDREAAKASIRRVSSNTAAVGQFQGLLSDEGLRQMARHLGQDWSRLAAALRLPTSVGSAASTYEVLKEWRDTYGDENRVRGRLCDALVTSRRADLAQKLIDEKNVTTSSCQDAAAKLVTVV